MIERTKLSILKSILSEHTGVETLDQIEVTNEAPKQKLSIFETVIND